MITKEEIFKMVSKVTRHSRGIKERQLINPEREWALGIVIFTILLLAGFWYNASLFSYYHNVEDHLANETVSIPNYNYGMLAKVLERYDERAKQFEEIKSGIEVQYTAVIELSSLASSTASTTESVDEEVDLATTTDSQILIETGSSTAPEIAE